MGKYDCPLLVWLDIYVGPMLERRTLELKPHIHTLKVQNWLWDEKYMIVHYFISHGTVFFSHNKSAKQFEVGPMAKPDRKIKISRSYLKKLVKSTHFFCEMGIWLPTTLCKSMWLIYKWASHKKPGLKTRNITLTP
jgi:hypothetical protein